MRIYYYNQFTITNHYLCHNLCHKNLKIMTILPSTVGIKEFK